MESVPDSLRNLKELQSLDLSECNLSGYPAAISQLDSLLELQLGSNTDYSFFGLYFRRFFPEDVMMDTPLVTGGGIATMLPFCPSPFYQNNLKALPTLALRLTNLQVLDVSNRGLESYPVVISQLLQLYKLNLEGNNLKSLPILYHI